MKKANNKHKNIQTTVTMAQITTISTTSIVAVTKSENMEQNDDEEEHQHKHYEQEHENRQHPKHEHLYCMKFCGFYEVITKTRL